MNGRPRAQRHAPIRRSQVLHVLRAALMALLASTMVAQMSGAQEPVSRRESDDYTFARRLYDRGDYDLAERQLRDFLLSYPESPRIPDIRFMLADADFRRARYATALELFERFRIEFGSSAHDDDALFRIGQSHFKLAHYREAAEAFSRLLLAYSESDLRYEAELYLGESRFELGQLEAAARSYAQAALGTGAVVQHALYSLGWVKQKLGQHDEAIEAFQEMLRVAPDHALAAQSLFKMGESLYQLGRYREAISAITDALPRMPDPQSRANGHYLLGESYRALDENDRARHHFDVILTDYGRTTLAPSALYATGWTYIAERDFAEAIRVMGQVAQRYPESEIVPDAEFRRAMALSELGRRDEAEAALTGILRSHARSEVADDASYELGTLAFNRRDFNLAEGAFRRVLGDYAESDLRMQATYMMGETMLSLGSLDSAVVYYTTIVGSYQSSPLVPKALFQRGWALLRLRRYREAIDGLGQLLGSWPDGEQAADAHYLLAEAWYALREYTRAANEYEIVATRYPDTPLSADARYGLGWTAFKQRNWDEAVRQFELAEGTSSNPQVRADAMLRIGDAHFNLGAFEDALAAYSTASELDSGNPRPVYYAAQSLFHLSRLADAISTYRRLTEEFPDSDLADDAWFMIGWSRLRSDDYPGAIEAYRHLTINYPASDLSPQAQMGIGDALYNSGRFMDAVGAYEDLLRRWPESDQIETAISGIWDSYLREGRIDQAVERTEQFIAENPLSPVSAALLMKRADWLYAAARYEEAAEIYGRISSEFVGVRLASSPLFWEANALAQLGRRQDAIDRFRRVADDDGPLAADALERIGDLEMDLGDYAAALTSYTLYDRRFPESSKRAAVLVSQARAHIALGNEIAADQTFRRAARAGGTSIAGARANLELAMLLIGRDGQDEARAIADSVLVSRSDQYAAEAQYVLGEVAYSLGRFEDAQLAFMRVRLVYEGFPEWVGRANLRLGDTFRELGNVQRARDAYREVVTSHPADTLGMQASRRLEQMGSE